MGSAASALENSRPSVIREIPPELVSWSDLPPLFKSEIGTDCSISDDTRNHRSWDFNIWLLEEEKLLLLTMHIVNEFRFPTLLGFETSAWCHLVWEVQRLMGTSINPYHNFRHVMDVAQSCACIVNEFGASFWLHDFDTFALYISAIVHDLEHPGTNNVYQVNAATPLAIRYNDISVLENHHCAKAFEVFMLPQCDITHNLKLDQKKSLRKTIISLVLITDMTQHFSLRAELDGVITRHMVDSVPAKLDEKDTLVVLKSIIHTCDISNPAKPWEVSKKWSDLVLQEFLEQGDREKREGLPVSMNCDRDTTVQDELSMNFTDFIVAPFFFSMAKLLPKMLRVCKIIHANRSEWNNLYSQRAVTAFPDEAVRAENLAKWEVRRVAFEDKISTLEANLKPLWVTSNNTTSTSVLV